MREVLLVLLSGVLTDNLVCAHCIGVQSAILSPDTFRRSAILGAYITALSTLVCGITYPVYHFVLLPLKAEYLSAFLFILLCAAAVCFSNKYLRFMRENFSFSQMTVTYGTVLGICCVCTYSQSFLLSLLSAFSYGLGLLLVMCVFFCARLSVKNSKIPKAFCGFPLDLVICAIIILVFYGWIGEI